MGGLVTYCQNSYIANARSYSQQYCSITHAFFIKPFNALCIASGIVARQPQPGF